MEQTELERVAEAILFAAGEPVELTVKEFDLLLELRCCNFHRLRRNFCQ